VVAQRGDLRRAPVAAIGERHLDRLVDAGVIELLGRQAKHRFQLAGVIDLLSQHRQQG
jgi:hypothetical protein